MTYEAFEAVRKFNEKNGQQVSYGYVKVDQKTKLLRIRLILEELGELSVAVHENNEIEVADGLGDLLYVVLGTGVSCGIDSPDSFIELSHRTTINDDWKNYHLSELTQSVSNYFFSLRKEGPDMIRITQDALCAEISLMASEFCIPFREVFFEIHRSNMTKTLGGATDGQKYGTKVPKGEEYQPPRIAEILEKRVNS